MKLFATGTFDVATEWDSVAVLGVYNTGIDKRYITVGSWYRSVYRMMVWNDCGVRRASACEIDGLFVPLVGVGVG